MIADANTVSMRIVICLKNYKNYHVVLVVKNLPADTGDSRDIDLIPGLGKIPWRRKWQPAQIFLPAESHGQKNLAYHRVSELVITGGTGHTPTQCINRKDVF